MKVAIELDAAARGRTGLANAVLTVGASHDMEPIR